MKLPSLLSLVLLFHISRAPSWVEGANAASAATQQINRGFSANPNPASSSTFQPLLSDPTNVFSFGFQRVNSTQLELAVLHVPSSLPVWRATFARPALWASSTTLSFNGSMVLSDTEGGVLWSTQTGGSDRVVLLNSSNLQVQKLAEPISVLWQSFDFPSNTLVQTQNLTSTAALFSMNRRYSMQLGTYYLALYMESGSGAPAPMYWKHSAMEAKAEIVAGEGPVYARVDPLGFLGMYQNEKAPVDVLAFDSFNRGIPGLRRLTLEDDGNLRAYNWNRLNWVPDFEAITEACSVPSTCGAYELCSTREPQCRCVDNRTDGCFTAESGDLCGGGREYMVVRSKGVDLANKELVAFQKVGSLEECEGSCERNCSCWGAVYNNATGYCYRMDYPVQLAVAVGDERKVGYFKVSPGGDGDGGGGGDGRVGRRAGTALLVVGAVVLAGATGYGAYRMWNKRRRAGADGTMGDGLSVGPYKDLSSSSSFRSIELTNSFRK